MAIANFKYNLHNPSDYFDNIKLEKIMTTKYFCFGILKIYAHPCAKTTQHWIEIFVRCGCPLETVSSIHYEVDGRGVWWKRNLGVRKWIKYCFTGYKNRWHKYVFLAFYIKHKYTVSFVVLQSKLFILSHIYIVIYYCVFVTSSSGFGDHLENSCM